jgi:hypothetical protein
VIVAICRGSRERVRTLGVDAHVLAQEGADNGGARGLRRRIVVHANGAALVDAITDREALPRKGPPAMIPSQNTSREGKLELRAPAQGFSTGSAGCEPEGRNRR